MATGLLIGGAVVCAVVVGLAFTQPRTLLTRPSQVVAFAVLPGLSAPSLIWMGTRLAPLNRVRAALAMTSVVLAVFFANVLLSVVSQVPDSRLGAADLEGEQFDGRTASEVVEQLRSEGSPAVPLIAPVNIILGGDVARRAFRDSPVQLPLGGVSGRPTVYCNESGEFLVYTSDQHGFHNPPEVWATQSVDVAVVGDSFAHGACVPSEKNVTGVLRERGVRAVNLGMGSAGPLQTLGQIKEYLPSLQPRSVFWLFYEGNDLRNLDFEYRHPTLVRYLESGQVQDLRSHQPEIDRGLLDYERANREAVGRRGIKHRLVSLLKLRALRERLSLMPEAASSTTLRDGDIERFRAILTEAKREVEAWGGRLHFVYLPVFWRYAEPERAPTFRREVIELAEDLGLPVVDIAEAFGALPDPLDVFPRRRYGHYNETGYRIIAEALVRPTTRRRRDDGGARR